ncbi:MAG TPA: tetratricopeptide repeat protein [Accumulibacter sp.]|uniref:tetratricopeptide repeat protein n=1 Tax=Accumulibacter sp. TaxID=2053492 RepID=UPI002627F9D1|nr:tetratricopeptide repeat protein [Accumulibacter sp.]MDS4053686.1 tetratricopeptide repeat protein [Accumulibacter sp.]HMV06481.1 tetratricopeptide repeat protein [Accumulibacter sp.]HMW63912.1 tetratricopeptide repeat protein [Accumulibacter sp.]HMW81481.1 tetratricopeptide repeat protein [Accumulibacter sp.]HMX67553.1 tetratricopeptide repeat protein [Accumulibacter sp.]
MTRTVIANLERMLGSPRDGALLRYSLGAEYLKAGEVDQAATYLADAVAREPTYSAAWKLLGRALTECGRTAQAVAAYEQGIAVATAKGDVQAAREMAVFARRLRQKAPGQGEA